MNKLDAFLAEKENPFKQNRLLFDWLRDDRQRAELYDELKEKDFPILRFKSMLRSTRGTGVWPDQDVYLVSARSDVERALTGFSVAPYAELESGGRFMLGLDDRNAHDAQNAAAWEALKFSRNEIAACARVAFERAQVQPLNVYHFDLVALAEQAALHFASLLFGLPIEAHTRLQRLIGAVYRRLTFQIIGRHFVANAGLPPTRSSDAERLKEELERLIREEYVKDHSCELQDKGLPKETVIGRLHGYYRTDPNEVVFVTIGLIAGTIGNVRAAVAIAIEHFFNQPNGNGGRLLDEAQHAAWQDDGVQEHSTQDDGSQDESALAKLINQALLRNPPAAFLARTARKLLGPPPERRGKLDDIQLDDIAEGAQVLLAIGADADPDLLFGGGKGFRHRCIGKHLARPLVEEIVRQVLRLPGLAQAIDPDTGKPFGLSKRWGASCETYPMQYRRDRRLNQQPLFVVLPIKTPVAENALARSDDSGWRAHHRRGVARLEARALRLVQSGRKPNAPGNDDDLRRRL
jgi:cytochrome P450